MCICVSVGDWGKRICVGVPAEVRKIVRSFGSGVTGCCRLPDLGAEYQTQVLCNRNLHSFFFLKFKF